MNEIEDIIKRLPKDVSPDEAATILGVNKKTVLRYVDDGIIHFRNIAPPSSTARRLRLLLDDVLSLRSGYTLVEKKPSLGSKPRAKISTGCAGGHFSF